MERMDLEEINLDVLTDDFDGCSDDDDGDGDYEFINEGASSHLTAGSEFRNNIFMVVHTNQFVFYEKMVMEMVTHSFLVTNQNGFFCC